MRIVVDLQGAQAQSRQRGIGRYTLALVRSMIQQRRDHEIIVALNGLFPDSVKDLREEFGDILHPEQVKIWTVPAPVSKIDNDNRGRWEIAECLYEAFLASLKPDCVLVTSLFEGIGDDAVTSVKMWHQEYPVAVILYDLIPLIHRSPYLDNPAHARWYDEKTQHLKRADRLLAISESTRQEGVRYLERSPSEIVNISSAIDPVFHPFTVDVERQQVLRAHYGLSRPFVMYTGGIDYRKNLEGLIRAFALLPESSRARYQLAVICAVQEPERERLQAMARRHGLAPDSLVLTGFVPEHDLLELYNLCELFVFPSWHEGFGLPALEAMACGAPVIASNTTSLPEVVGCEEALFDPRDDHSISGKIEQVLGDPEFRQRLREHGIAQAKKFSWEKSADAALEAVVELACQHKSAFTREPAERDACHSSASDRPRLAYVSPLPPEKSGISNYSSELLPVLAKYYSIDVIVDQVEVVDRWVEQNCSIRDVQWLRDHAQDYDRVLYQFGNSAFHQHMFDLLDEIPGVVVLHDFFLSGIVAHREWFFGLTNSWVDALYHSHGYHAVAERCHRQDAADVIWKYPCNLHVLQQAQGVIVHSPNSRRMAKDWYGPSGDTDWFTIPHLRQSVEINQCQRQAARQALGLSADDLVVCSFGFIGPTKLNHRLLDAWLQSSLARDQKAVLIFVGEKDSGDYGKKLSEHIRSSGLADRISITGWADDDAYHRYLAAADIAVQLRTLSRGETSGAVLHAMNYGLATVVNANGSMADLPDNVVAKLPDAFSDAELVRVLEELHANVEQRQRIGRAAAQQIRHEHAPEHCARLYYDAIETAHRYAAVSAHGLVKSLGSIPAVASLSEAQRCELAACVDSNMPERPRLRHLLLDVTPLLEAGDSAQPLTAALLDRWLKEPPYGYRVEPVYVGKEGYYLYARNFALSRLDCSPDLLPEEPVNPRDGDLWLGLELPEEHRAHYVSDYDFLQMQGIHVGLAGCDELPGSIDEQVKCFMELLPPSGESQAHPKLLVDVSELARRDAGSGIQRVVRNILDKWREEPPAGYRVIPIYSTEQRPGYYYATRFALSQFGWPTNLLPEDPVDPRQGDSYLGLDLQPVVVIRNRDTYRRWREQGINTQFVVYDLLCVRHPQFFNEGAGELFSRWLQVVSECDGLIAISRAVADQLRDWLAEQAPAEAENAQRRPAIEWFHLGADFDAPTPTMTPAAVDEHPLPPESRETPTFLMVGTLEPRKGHQQVLAAFEALWKEGISCNLVLVGKQGWQVEALVTAITQHEERDRRLFWFEQCTDAELDRLYRSSDCLIAASYDEGFGLPLIEAARYRLPVVARDIPVFREVAGEHASYFSSLDAGGLATSLREWLAAYAKEQHPRSDAMPWQSWQDSARQLADRLTKLSERRSVRSNTNRTTITHQEVS